jgi:HEAT repeat protein
MRSSFGPWATAVEVGRGPGLSTFWRRRLAMLHSTSQSRPSLTRRMALWLVATGAVACALPTFRGFSAATRAEESQATAAQRAQVSPAESGEAKDRGQSAPSEAPAKRTVPKEKLRYAERSFEEWKRVLATDLDLETRKKAIEALGALGAGGYGEEAVAEIVEALKPGDSQTVAQAASSALGRIGPPAVPALMRLLKHQQPLVRNSAAGALLSFWTPAKAKSALPAVPELVEATRDGDTSVRSLACAALGKIMAPAQTPQLLKSVVPALATALKDGDQEVRVSAARALGTIGPKAAPAVPALIEALRASWPKPPERGADGRGRGRRPDTTFSDAIDALGAIGPAAKAAVPVLTEIRDPKDRNPYIFNYRRRVSEVLEKIETQALSPAEGAAPVEKSP